MMKNELVARIKNAKVRMDEIASIRPSNTELIDEFMRLQKGVVEDERKLREIDGEEFAFPIEGLDVWWDRRTQKILVFSDCSTRKRSVITFRHARVPLGPEDSVALIAFNNVLGTKTRSMMLDESLDYPSGIIGIDNLGMFRVQNSTWLRDIDSGQHEGVFHYCAVFAHCLFECLSSSYEITSSEGRGEAADLFLREITLP